ncbi:hypothetical protein ACFY00_30285 [Kitasatospora sp. NPDC001540]|uniref:hypothetical protein n=1 Tax=Kitasatospora sp. NPDC001540 TaxID=3364014 RepID=UPI0036A0365D
MTQMMDMDILSQEGAGDIAQVLERTDGVNCVAGAFIHVVTDQVCGYIRRATDPERNCRADTSFGDPGRKACASCHAAALDAAESLTTH